jgi:hypothetical protein
MVRPFGPKHKLRNTFTLSIHTRLALKIPVTLYPHAFKLPRAQSNVVLPIGCAARREKPYLIRGVSPWCSLLLRCLQGLRPDAIRGDVSPYRMDKCLNLTLVKWFCDKSLLNQTISLKGAALWSLNRMPGSCRQVLEGVRVKGRIALQGRECVGFISYQHIQPMYLTEMRREAVAEKRVACVFPEAFTRERPCHILQVYATCSR